MHGFAHFWMSVVGGSRRPTRPSGSVKGEHPKYIQAQIGHSSINVTMDTVNRAAADRLGEQIFDAN